LEVRPGMTLISCSGTIGRMVYARPDMAGMWSSQDIMKVCPDPARIPPGYLYAFLSCRFGLPMVTAGTYGAIIQHIEPEHIADVPIPRLGADLESAIHSEIQASAEMRSTALVGLSQIAARFDQLASEEVRRLPRPRVAYLSSRKVQRRLDAQFHDPRAIAVRSKFATMPHRTLKECCASIYLPGIFKRVHVEDPNYGVPYFTGASLFWLEPTPKALLSRKTNRFDEVVLKTGCILVQAFGQGGGLTGRSVWVGESLSGKTTTHMLVRLQAPDEKLAAYLYGFLQSEAAYAQLLPLSYGGSIPHFDEREIESVVVPILDAEIDKIAKKVIDCVNMRERALEHERGARQLIEEIIAGAA
jgi:type I restriction enzyme, S subunit